MLLGYELCMVRPCKYLLQCCRQLSLLRGCLSWDRAGVYDDDSSSPTYLRACRTGIWFNSRCQSDWVAPDEWLDRCLDKDLGVGRICPASYQRIVYIIRGSVIQKAILTGRIERSPTNVPKIIWKVPKLIFDLEYMLRSNPGMRSPDSRG